MYLSRKLEYIKKVYKPNGLIAIQDKKEIRKLHNDGYSNRKIAKMFNANHQTINDIINRKYYKN